MYLRFSIYVRSCTKGKFFCPVSIQPYHPSLPLCFQKNSIFNYFKFFLIAGDNNVSSDDEEDIIGPAPPAVTVSTVKIKT